MFEGIHHAPGTPVLGDMGGTGDAPSAPELPGHWTLEERVAFEAALPTARTIAAHFPPPASAPEPMPKAWERARLRAREPLPEGVPTAVDGHEVLQGLSMMALEGLEPATVAAQAAALMDQRIGLLVQVMTAEEREAGDLLHRGATVRLPDGGELRVRATPSALSLAVGAGVTKQKVMLELRGGPGQEGAGAGVRSHELMIFWVPQTAAEPASPRVLLLVALEMERFEAAHPEKACVAIQSPHGRDRAAQLLLVRQMVHSLRQLVFWAGSEPAQELRCCLPVIRARRGEAVLNRVDQFASPLAAGALLRRWDPVAPLPQGDTEARAQAANRRLAASRMVGVLREHRGWRPPSPSAPR